MDELAAVLVDPDLHTDMRMHLQQQITGLLRAAQKDAGGPGEPAEPEPVPAPHAGLADLVSAVLTDPNVHSELRMRICREIPEMLAFARAGSPAARPDRGR